MPRLVIDVWWNHLLKSTIICVERKRQSKIYTAIFRNIRATQVQVAYSTWSRTRRCGLLRRSHLDYDIHFSNRDHRELTLQGYEDILNHVVKSDAWSVDRSGERQREREGDAWLIVRIRVLFLLWCMKREKQDYWLRWICRHIASFFAVKG